MKFIWNEPKPYIDTGMGGSYYAFPEGSFWEKPILGWLMYHDIFLRRTAYGEPRTYELTYNYPYHFFDFYIYEDKINGGREPIERMRTLLEKSGLKYRAEAAVERDNRQDPSLDIPGTRFWIYAEDRDDPEWKREKRTCEKEH